MARAGIIATGPASRPVVGRIAGRCRLSGVRTLGLATGATVPPEWPQSWPRLAWRIARRRSAAVARAGSLSRRRSEMPPEAAATRWGTASQAGSCHRPKFQTADDATDAGNLAGQIDGQLLLLRLADRAGQPNVGTIDLDVQIRSAKRVHSLSAVCRSPMQVLRDVGRGFADGQFVDDLTHAFRPPSQIQEPSAAGRPSPRGPSARRCRSPRGRTFRNL